jgi:arsenate reductase
MSQLVHHVLFVCTGNSVRSIMAEALLNALGGGRFRGYSAGSKPQERVHPLALETLAANGYSIVGLRSKKLDEFLRPDAPVLDFVIIVSDAAAASCPVFPRAVVTAHWGVDDPDRSNGTDQARRQAFQESLGLLRRRVQQLTGLPFESVDKHAMGGALRVIGMLA